MRRHAIILNVRRLRRDCRVSVHGRMKNTGGDDKARQQSHNRRLEA